MMETLERIHRLYFAKTDKNIAQKNRVLRKEFQKILDRSKEEAFKEMYRVNCTFGITVPVNHDRVKSFINGELHNMDWYQEHGYDDIALAIPGYIVGYCLFYYSVPKPIEIIFISIIRSFIQIILKRWDFSLFIMILLLMNLIPNSSKRK